MYMKCTRVSVNKEALKKIIKLVPGNAGKKMNMTDAANYAVQKLIDQLSKNEKDE